jgi:CRISPR-associated protein Cmr2
MTDNKRYLHLTFSPVQSFVAQARRTRDLWAGSYLLAWLAGKAMAKIVADHGTAINVPDITDDKLFQAIQHPDKADDDDNNNSAKSLGTLPNRFTATLPDHISPKHCADYAATIQREWIKLAKVVRDWIDPDKKIDDRFWDRQINNHWEITWVMGDSALLDGRKNLRLPNQNEEKCNEESGEKCTVCGERQELSECRKTPPYRPDRNASKKWWATFKTRAQANLAKTHVNMTALDLRENERLCAVCLTKRAFPLVAKQAIGWEVDPYYPSTAYLSAIDWLQTVLLTAADKTADNPVQAAAIRTAANELVATAEKLKLYHSEYNTKIKCLTDTITTSGINEKLIQLDGDMFYLAAIDSDQLETRGSNDKLNKEEKQKLSRALSKLQKAVGSSATPFYALLLMDGDGMGKLLGKQDGQGRSGVSKALAAFTHAVPDIVELYNGRLIYAGGDDVFALLPVRSAIACAAACQVAYKQAFADFPPDIKKAATISAAVQFAHQNIALSVVVKDAHRLLDDIAKDYTGRDALACRVWKPGGPVLTWSQPWTAEDGGECVQLLETVINDFHPDRQSEHFSSKFFHKLRDLFELVENDGCFNADEIHALLVVEYLANRELKETDKSKKEQIAADRIKHLLALCQEQRRIVQDDKITYEKGHYNADAALLVRFLVQKEV